MNREAHGKAFLEFVSRNTEKLKRALAKNVTYDRDLLEDIFGETVIKIYDSITVKGKRIHDFESFFYISSRNNYNDARRKAGRMKAAYAAASSEGDEWSLPCMLEVKEDLAGRFTTEESELFLDYMWAKLSEPGRLCYRDYAQRHGLSGRMVERTVSGIKKHLREKYNGIYQQAEEEGQ